MLENRQAISDNNQPSFNADARRSRLSYLVITILILIGMALSVFLVAYFTELMGSNLIALALSLVLSLLIWGVRLFLLFILFIVTNQRLNDVGWHGAWSILVIVPLISLPLFLILFIRPTKATDENT
jgi:uncharacterized membrane protein YhaH (DUF805 family)